MLSNNGVNNSILKKKTLFIGLDGGTWDIIDPLMAEGKLPNLKKLMQSGTYGALESAETMISPSVWTTIFTGKTAKNHGIHNFMTMQNQLKARRLWNIFEDNNKTVGIGGFLMTWPPKVKLGNSFMISDQFAPDSVTIPEEVSFIRELTNMRQFSDKLTLGKAWGYFQKAMQHGIDFSTLLKAGQIFFWRKLTKAKYLDYFHREMTVFLWFMERIFGWLAINRETDFSAVYFPGTDILAHKYWCYFRPEEFDYVTDEEVKKYGQVIPQQYIEADKAIGRLVSRFQKKYGEQLDIFVLSDHGFQSCKDAKYVPKAKVDFLLEKMGLAETFTYTQIGHSTIFHPSTVDSSQKKEHLEKLKKFVEGIVTIDKNISVFQTEPLDENLKISSQPLWKGYDFGDPIKFNGEQLLVEDILEKGMLLTGMHEKMGMFVFSGPDIKQNHKVEGASVYDITPTILALNGFPVADDIEGKVLTDVAVDEFWKKHPVAQIDSYGAPDDVAFSESEMEAVKSNEDELKARLKSLGYMS